MVGASSCEQVSGDTGNAGCRRARWLEKRADEAMLYLYMVWWVVCFLVEHPIFIQSTGWCCHQQLGKLADNSILSWISQNMLQISEVVIVSFQKKKKKKKERKGRPIQIRS